MIKKTASQLLKEKLYPLNISSDLSRKKKVDFKKLKKLAYEIRELMKDDNTIRQEPAF